MRDPVGIRIHDGVVKRAENLHFYLSGLMDRHTVER
jgi:hypothetical protein